MNIEKYESLSQGIKSLVPSEIIFKVSNDPSQIVPEEDKKTLNVEKMIKRILRSFRKNLKDMFLAKYTK
jgi:hypothetical protein